MYNTVYANQREREESLYERRVMSVKKHYYYHPELPIYLNLTGRHAGREWMIACKLTIVKDTVYVCVLFVQVSLACTFYLHEESV